MWPPTISSAPARDELRQHVVAACDRLLARAPRRADQLVVERDHAQRAAALRPEPLGGPRKLRVVDAARLVAPRDAPS